MTTTRRAMTLCARVLLGGMLLAATARAQGAGTLAGVVREDSTGRPIAGAEVAVEALKRLAVTDAEGRFRLTDVAAGVRMVTVRRLGYAPQGMMVQFLPNETVERTISLSVSATALDTMRVRERPARPLTGRLAFDDRKARGFGRFLDSTDLRKMPDLRVSMLVQNEGGIKTVQPPVCALTNRKVNCVGTQSYRIAVGRDLCAMKIMLDGMVVGVGGAIDPSEPRPDPRHNWYTSFDVSSINTGSLDKIEIYRRELDIPPELISNDTGCGLIMLWTRQN